MKSVSKNLCVVRVFRGYRYAWAERALKCGFPERFAQEALGHNSKAVHHAYSKHAEVTVPSLADWEKDCGRIRNVAGNRSCCRWISGCRWRPSHNPINASGLRKRDCFCSGKYSRAQFQSSIKRVAYRREKRSDTSCAGRWDERRTD